MSAEESPSQATSAREVAVRLTHFDTLAFAVLLFGLWTILVRYRGLQHDAQLYVLQALAHLHPEIYRGDLFLRFGSQDSFTAFPAVSASLIGVIGIDAAAAILTLASLSLLYVSVWLLVRRLVGSTHAWLAVAMLIVVPGWYGKGHVFQIAEQFLSARLPAEALGVAGLWAMVSGRYMLAIILIGTAAAVHPLMAVPAAIVGIAIAANRTRPDWHLALIPATVTLLAAIAAHFALGDSVVMHGDWLEAVRTRSSFLFLDTWELPDWLPVAAIIGTLTLSASALGPRVRPLAVTAIWTALGGFLLTAVATWWFPLTLIIQVQPWRWVWVATLLTVSLLPATISAMWKGNGSGRTTAILLVAGWSLATAAPHDQFITTCGTVLVLAALVTYLARNHGAVHGRLPMASAWTVASFAAFWIASHAWTEVSVDFDFGGDPAWLQTLTGVLKIPAVAASFVVVGVRAVRSRSHRPWASVLVALTGLATLFAAAPGSWAAWTSSRFVRPDASSFHSWRTHIDEDQEVFWPDGLQWTWFAVERRSYLSVSQLAGVVFSEAVAAEARNRAAALSPVYQPGYWFNVVGTSRRDDSTISLDDLLVICSAPDLDFYVSAKDLGLSVASAEWPTHGMFVHLYDCASVRRSIVN